jgi:hypothetical protein
MNSTRTGSRTNRSTREFCAYLFHVYNAFPPLHRNSVLLSRRFRRDPRDLDDEEEMWFNNDEEDIDDCDASLADSLNYKLEAEYDQFNKKALERKNLGICHSLCVT